MLGADFAAGRALRSHGRFSKAAARWRTMRQRLRKTSRLRAISRRRAAQRILHTGVLPAALYSVTVRGLLDSEVLSLQQISAATGLATGHGTSRTRSLLVTTDFSAQQVVEPLHFHCLMLWQSAQHHHTVASLPQLVSDWKAQNSRGWPKVMAGTKGPFGVVAVTLARLGWHPTASPTEFLDERLQRISVLRLGPAMVKHLALVSWRARLQEKAARSLEGGRSLPLSAPASTFSRQSVAVAAAMDSLPAPLAAQPPPAATAIGLDSYHIRQLADRQGKFRDLSPLEVGCAQNFLVGGVWILQRLATAGYDLAGLSSQCPLCGLHPDTVHDRLFSCSHTASLRSSVLSAAELLTLKDPAFATEAAGWVLRPPPPPTEDETPHSQIICLDCQSDTLSLSEVAALPWHDAFVDCTCTMHAHHPAYRRSAWAVVLQTATTDNFEASLVGPVNSPLPQTSGAAEMCALSAVHQLADDAPDSTIARTAHTDYLAAARCCSGMPLASLLHYRRLYSGLLRELQAMQSFRRLTVCKVNAHTGGTTTAELGNAEADRLCKEYAASWYDAQPVSRIDHCARSSLATKVALLAAKALPLFPAMRELAATVGFTRFVRPARAHRARAKPPPRAPPARPHLLLDVPGSAAAVRCCACATTFACRSAPAACSECSQHHPVLHQAPRGHNIFIVFVQRGTTDGELFSICTRCALISVCAALPGPCLAPASPSRWG